MTVLGLNNCIWGWDLPQVGSRGQENGSVGEWQCAVNPCEIPGLSSHNCFHGLQCFGGHCGVFELSLDLAWLALASPRHCLCPQR